MDFEELGKKLKKFSQDTMTEVQKMNEVRQLNGKIADEKKLLNRLYLEMGQKLYDTYKDAELPLDGFDGEFRKIRERYAAIDLLQEKIRGVKGVVLCPCCNMEVAAGERYCTNCGNKMPETVKIEESVDKDAVEVESTVVEPEEQPEAAAKADPEETAEHEPVEPDLAEVQEEATEEAEPAEKETMEPENEKAAETSAEHEAEEPETAVPAEAGASQPENTAEAADQVKAESGETEEEAQAEEALREAAEETGVCARSAHEEETEAAEKLAEEAETAVEEAEKETAEEAGVKE